MIGAITRTGRRILGERITGVDESVVGDGVVATPPVYAHSGVHSKTGNQRVIVWCCCDVGIRNVQVHHDDHVLRVMAHFLAGRPKGGLVADICVSIN